MGEIIKESEENERFFGKKKINILTQRFLKKKFQRNITKFKSLSISYKRAIKCTNFLLQKMYGINGRKFGR